MQSNKPCWVTQIRFSQAQSQHLRSLWPPGNGLLRGTHNSKAGSMSILGGQTNTIPEWIWPTPMSSQWVSDKLYIIYFLWSTALVLNPCTWMVWISQHWDEDYIAKAERIVKNTVSPRLSISFPWFIVTDATVLRWLSTVSRPEAPQRLHLRLRAPLIWLQFLHMHLWQSSMGWHAIRSSIGHCRSDVGAGVSVLYYCTTVEAGDWHDQVLGGGKQSIYCFTDILISRETA